jgi:hypothetical protein
MACTSEYCRMDLFHINVFLTLPPIDLTGRACNALEKLILDVASRRLHRQITRPSLLLDILGLRPDRALNPDRPGRALAELEAKVGSA